MRTTYNLIFLFLAGCVSTKPEIISSKGTENVVIASLRDQISEPGLHKVSYSWLWWYIPIASMVILWAVSRIFLNKKKV